MQLKNYSFDRLPFTKLFRHYVSDFSRVASFYEANPFEADSIAARLQSFKFGGDRKVSADLLGDFNRKFDSDNAALENIDRLRRDNSLALVTGQQLGLYGGPMFTIYKALTAISLANQLENKLNRPVIPVFWLADEDHDYDEVNSIEIITEQEPQLFSLPGKKGALSPVAKIKLPDELSQLRESLQSTLVETDFTNDLWQLLDGCFQPGNTFLESFGNFITRLFSRHGLVLAGSNTSAIKEQVKESMIQSVASADEIQKALKEQSKEIEQQFHRQAEVYHSHLFYLHPERGRLKIRRVNGHWEANERQWNDKELIGAIESSPERFSPDVFLRPVLQDRLLPTFGYVGGPGEAAYYGQMKSFYRCFNQQMPIIFPRLSATLIEPAIERVMAELPFELYEYDRRIEDLESDFVDRTEQLDIEALFKHWQQEAKKLASSSKQKITAVDETLEGAVEKAQAVYDNELNQLKGKVYRAVKKQDDIQLKRIRRIQQHLFPKRTLQERAICGIYFMNKYGLDIWDRLLDEMDPRGGFDRHQLIYL